MIQYRGPFVLQQPEEAWFDVNMMQKDMLLAMELGRQLNVPVPTTAVSNEFLTAARGMGWEKKDFAVVFDVLARMSGVAEMTTAAERSKTTSANQRRTDGSAPVPADDGDPAVRRAGQRSLHARADAGTGPPLYRRRSSGGRSLRGAPAGRLHYQHASRAWPLSGEGRVPGPHVCGTAGQRSRLLPGQRRLDAHCRSGDRQSGRECHRGRQRRDRHRRGVCRQTSGQRASCGLLLRRRRSRAGVAL